MHVSEHTRFIAGSPGVRKLLVEKQREIGRRLGSLVTEGRDQGSVAFPSADFKFFVDAEVEKRAERRYHELLADGEDVTLEQVIENVRERDRTDSQRQVAPLIEPTGAIHIDTSHLSIHQVVDLMLSHLRRAGVEVPADHVGDAAHATHPPRST
jgi:cytidylate kinase